MNHRWVVGDHRVWRVACAGTVVLLAAVLSVGAETSEERPMARADAVFQNRTFGFSVVYPASWDPRESHREERGGLHSGVVSFFSPEPREYAVISVIVKPLEAGAQTPDRLAAATLETLQRHEPKMAVLVDTPTSLREMPAHEILFTGPSTDPQQPMTIKQWLVFWVKGPYGYVFSYTHKASKFEDERPAAQRALASLSWGSRRDGA